jgi:hypothetical protein
VCSLWANRLVYLCSIRVHHGVVVMNGDSNHLIPIHPAIVLFDCTTSMAWLSAQECSCQQIPGIARSSFEVSLSLI